MNGTLDERYLWIDRKQQNERKMEWSLNRLTYRQTCDILYILLSQNIDVQSINIKI